nr:SDR family oxidoreductase [Sphingomonas sp. CDS-1]
MDIEPDGWAVVAGATGSLGSAISAKLASMRLKVLAIGRNEAELTKLSRLGNIHPCIVDMADNSAIDIVKRHIEGPVKIVVQALGLPIRPKDQPFDPASVGKAVNIKIGGLLRLVEALDHQLHEGSRIVALGGNHGFEPDPTATSPGVTNAAMANLVRQLSVPYGKRGISVHLVSPGPVNTPRIRKLAADTARITGETAEQALDGWRAESSFGKLISVEQVAWAVALLLDKEADALHGSVIHLDGGRRKGIV